MGVALGQIGENGVHRLIFWRGFSQHKFGTDGTGVAIDLPGKIPGCVPYSPDNTAVFAFDQFQTIQDGGTAMDTRYLRSNVTEVSLHSLYICCDSATELSTTSKPLPCIMSLTCNKKDGGKVGPQDFDFDVTAVQTSAEMKKIYPTGLTNCSNIEFKARGKLLMGAPVPTDLLTRGMIDSIDYSVA